MSIFTQLRDRGLSVLSLRDEHHWRGGSTFVGLVCAMALTLSPLANAALPTTSTQPGDFVTNPLTGTDQEVLQVITSEDNGAGDTLYVITRDGSLILTQSMVDDLLERPDGTYKVISVEDSNDNGYVDTINIQLQNDDDPPPAIVSEPVVAPDKIDLGLPSDAQGAAGEAEVTPPQSTAGVINEVKRGASGDAGNDGYGIEVCDPFGLLGCGVIG